ncbi:MAG: bifunctional diaminohydroxyphosphoribosylaminopyrimidine deaminase/5-amino-6-(5-phosphoribosylamino)uracil reductase RibD [Verrucomicrobia bacterium]|nr:bifunctional diaminohydroxyphosphoribosylaminopyrimidine deaminase/5-amino-6-(5-phosphoribosylamino)uracil reductase RibD [Verrucomicrobiota bacterium]
MVDLDKHYMRLALRQARRGLGKTSPNPAVGAVLVRDGVILGTGWHRHPGGPHAEVDVLSALPRRELAAGATLYVTLEPCSTTGRTPPCTEAIIAAKIGRVVLGAIDVNPKHQGRGLEQLRRAGIAITTGVLEEESGLLNVGFNKWITTGMPWVIAKFAQSLDGRITRPAGEPRWLSNDQSFRMVQQLRATVDAILVGAETVRRDNPRLTVRTSAPGVQPWRIVVTRSGNLPTDATIFTDEFRDRTLVCHGIGWLEAFRDLGTRGITRLLVEGGGDVLGQLHDLQLIDEAWCFLTPMLTGGNKPSFGGTGVQRTEDASRFHHIRYRRMGNDVLVTGYLLRGALLPRSGQP